MPLPTRRHAVPNRLPDLLDWLDTPWPALLPFRAGETFRVEEYTEDGKYIIRAELPGLDPEKDVEVTVDSGLLTIHAERREETKKDRRTEFRYGSLTRSVSLPDGTDPDKVSAAYDNGILVISVPTEDHGRSESRRVSVERRSHGAF